MKTHSLVIAIFILFSFTASAQSNFIGSGISLAVNGENGNYLELGDVYNDLNFPFTIEAWVYPTAWTAFGDYAPIISTDNSSVGSYYGLWFRFNSAGKLILEIGDGSGSGSTDRRGKITSTSIQLNQWTHVAVVATSVTDFKFYFNGVLQTSSSTDGGASNTSLVHNSNPASIGRQITPFNEHNFIGQLDEVRLWTNSKSVEEIRTNMCSKITVIPDGLIGYWNFDESYDSETSVDLTSPAEDGTLEGSADKITSGAPIGDESVFLYPEDWTGIKMNIYTDNDDYFRIKEIMNNPKGMHIYRVDDSPYYDDGISDHPGYYFGVFPVNGAVAAQYGISYRFSPSNGVVTVDNADLATLYTKENGAITSWNNLDAVIDGEKLFIRKPGNTTRKEIIFTINDLAILGDDANNNKEAAEEIKNNAFPNPTSDFVFIKNVNDDETICLIDINGKIIETDYVIQDRICRINLTGISKGIYFVYGLKSSVSFAKIEVL